MNKLSRLIEKFIYYILKFSKIENLMKILIEKLIEKFWKWKCKYNVLSIYKGELVFIF